MKKEDIIPIEITASSIKHSGSNYYYIRHIFYALREHAELLEDSDYKRLYDEAQDFLFRYAVKSCGLSKDEREWGYDCIELLADLLNAQKSTEKYSLETVDSLIAERRKIWKSY